MATKVSCNTIGNFDIRFDDFPTRLLRRLVEYTSLPYVRRAAPSDQKENKCITRRGAGVDAQPCHIFVRFDELEGKGAKPESLSSVLTSCMGEKEFSPVP